MAGKTGSSSDKGNINSAFKKPVGQGNIDKFQRKQPGVFELKKQVIDLSNRSGDEEDSVFEQINVDLISPSPFQHRVRFNEKDLKELAHSIEENGLTHPITVRKKEGGGFELIAGERRLRAVRDILERPTIEAKIRKVDDKKAAYICFTENFDRQNLCEYEIYNWVSIMKRDLGISQKEIAETLKLSKVRISQIMSVGKLPKDVMKRIVNLKLAENHIRALRRLQKFDFNLMYRLLGEIEAAAATGNPMTSEEVLKRCSELLQEVDKITTPVDLVTIEFINKISNVIARYNKFTEEEKQHIKAKINLTKQAIKELEKILN